MTTSTLKYAETWGYYAPLINSGFVLIEMFLTVRHVSNYSQKWWFSLKNSFSSGKIYLDNFIEQKDPICEVCKRRAVSALQGTFGSVVKQPAFDEGCRQWPQKRHTYWCICRWSLGHLTKSSSCRLANKTIKQMLFWTLRLC